ncbi:MAG: ferrochelatase [Arcobacteraceae bacterium]|jgi:ferrochelatase|nr:ferrochelatase [Arcobacteraceae bacterium]MDY0365618.1 ferrochelatase [Arcobacteraceae bacterium]
MKKALVLLNMGGPRNKEEFEMFLRNMFNDPNILTIKNDFFRSIIASFIVMSRKNSAWQNYEAIGGSSPINPLTKELVDKLSTYLPDYYITWAMRYTPPFAPKIVKEIEQRGIKEVVLLPLYPQYSTTTTKSSVDDFMKACKDNEFEFKIVRRFYKNELYNQSIAQNIKQTLNGCNISEYNIIFSAHGLPQSIVDKGDSYENEVLEHIDILTTILAHYGIEPKAIKLAYQSKVGPMKWLSPSLDDKLKKFKDEKVLIYPISFTIDNSETVFELDIEYRELAMELGIKEYKVCKCENSSPLFIDALVEIVKELE